jgi:hypothetical protein
MTQQATTPFVKSSASQMLGHGSPAIQCYDQTVLAATGTITLTPATSQINAQPFTQGRLRIKSSAVNAATTQGIGVLTGSDGTNTVVLASTLLPTTAAGQNFDVIQEFSSDLQLTSLSFTVTLAGATTAATISSELFANP